MPNHVTNHIGFSAHWMQARYIVNSILNDRREVDFSTLIPVPMHVYHGNLSREDDRDFPINWDAWNRSEWGTKWNAYSTRINICGNSVDIYFDTAWSPPRPFITAFFNRWGIPFVFESYCEGGNFAIREDWGRSDRPFIGSGRLSCTDYSDAASGTAEFDVLADMALRLKGFDLLSGDFIDE